MVFTSSSFPEDDEEPLEARRKSAFLLDLLLPFPLAPFCISGGFTILSRFLLPPLATCSDSDPDPPDVPPGGSIGMVANLGGFST